MSLQIQNQPVPYADQDDFAGLKLQSATKLKLAGGQMIGLRSDPPLLTVRFIANVLITKEIITTIGKFAPTLYINTFICESRWQRTLALHPSESGQPFSESSQVNKTQLLACNRVLTVEVTPLHKVYVGPELSLRCLFRDNKRIIGLGSILAYEVVRGETLEWRDQTGTAIADISEWESKLSHCVQSEKSTGK